jgi:hypothetical protein
VLKLILDRVEDRPDVHLRMGLVLFRMGLLDEAMQSLAMVNGAREEIPDFDADPEVAIAGLRDAISYSGWVVWGRVALHLALAHFLKRQGEFEEALGSTLTAGKLLRAIGWSEVADLAQSLNRPSSESVRGGATAMIEYVDFNKEVVNEMWDNVSVTFEDFKPIKAFQDGVAIVGTVDMDAAYKLTEICRVNIVVLGCEIQIDIENQQLNLQAGLNISPELRAILTIKASRELEDEIKAAINECADWIEATAEVTPTDDSTDNPF